MIGYDSFSELPGIHLGTSWTVRSAMLMYKEGGKKLLETDLQNLFKISHSIEHSVVVALQRKR